MNLKAAGDTLQALFDHFEDKYVVSLASRPDRRKRVVKSLARLGVDFEASGLKWCDGLVFDEAAGFPNIGVRGCFNSHFSLMRQCAQTGRPMLVMEDDVDFDEAALARFGADGPLALPDNWELLYFGYLEPTSLPLGEGFRPYSGRTIGGHFYAVHPDFAGRVAAFMASCLTRKPGDPEGGPMYRDAAFNFYRERHPDCAALLAPYSLAGQFSSRSDLARHAAFYDKVPGLRSLAELGRRMFGPVLKKRNSARV